MEQYNRGFTLVELLVTIGIVMILMVVSIPNFAKYRNLSDLSNAGKLIQSEIYKTRSLSLAPATNKNPETNAYVFDLVKTEDTSYTMQIKQVNYVEKTNSYTDLGIVETLDIPKNISITCDATGLCFESIFSIEKYGRIVEISSSTENIENPLVFDIDVSSIKVSNIIKSVGTNKITGQVSIITNQTNE